MTVVIMATMEVMKMGLDGPIAMQYHLPRPLHASPPRRYCSILSSLPYSRLLLRTTAPSLAPLRPLCDTILSAGHGRTLRCPVAFAVVVRVPTMHARSFTSSRRGRFPGIVLLLTAWPAARHCCLLSGTAPTIRPRHRLLHGSIVLLPPPDRVV